VGSDISFLGGCSEGSKLLDEPVGHLLNLVDVPVGQLGGIPCITASSLDVTRDTDKSAQTTLAVRIAYEGISTASLNLSI